MRRKHVPQRTCVGCRKIQPKREMVRIVCTPDQGVRIDESGKASGRGAYLCRKRPCWERALAEKRLEHALKIKLIVPAPEEKVRQPEIPRTASQELTLGDMMNLDNDKKDAKERKPS